jgi:hypothetical protein
MMWEKGPLGYNASAKDNYLWHYWVPELPNGLWRAWYMPSFKSRSDALLGDDLTSEDEAKKLYEEHYARSRQKTDQ